jgi:hypothetical protein
MSGLHLHSQCPPALPLFFHPQHEGQQAHNAQIRSSPLNRKITKLISFQDFGLAEPIVRAIAEEKSARCGRLFMRSANSRTEAKPYRISEINLSRNARLREVFLPSCIATGE